MHLKQSKEDACKNHVDQETGLKYHNNFGQRQHGEIKSRVPFA